MKQGTWGKTCTCGCGCGWQGGHRVFRVILGIIVLIVVLWVGVKIGEYKMIVAQYGGYGSRGGYSNTYYPGGRMMNGGGAYPVTGPTSNPPSSATGTSAQ